MFDMFNKKRKCFLAMTLCLLILLCLPVWCQDQDGEDEEDDSDQIKKLEEFIKKKRINAAYVIAGAHRQKLDRLNNFLHNNQLPPVSTEYFTLGLGGHLILQKFVIGLELMRFTGSRTVSKKNFNTSATGKYSFLNFGYLLYSKKGMMIYPLAGIGYGALSLEVMQNNIQSLNDITTSQGINIARTSSMLVNLGCGLDYFFKYNPKKKGKNKFMIGVRMGYIASPSKGGWKVNHMPVADGPRIGLCGPYVRVVFGLGGWMEKLIVRAIQSS